MDMYFESPFEYGFGFAIKSTKDYDQTALLKEEIGILGEKAVIKRRMEFCLGRQAAHHALECINRAVEPIKRGTFNEPIWPQGIVGAITHSGDIAMSVVAPCDKASGIGIDVEYLNKKVSIDIAKKICLKEELNWVMEDDADNCLRMVMVFSAKESVFKAFFPIEHIYLGFGDAELMWDGAKFQGKLMKKAGNNFWKGYRFEVGCKIKDNYVFTYMHLPPMK